MLRSFVSYQSMFFCDAFASANIWLYHVLHDNLHCLVFKEHPPFIRPFVKGFRESASIWYLSAFALSRRILNFFFSKQLRFIGFIVVCGAVLSLSAADLIYNTRLRCSCQQFFQILFRTRGSFNPACHFDVQGTPTTASRSPSLWEGGWL